MLRLSSVIKHGYTDDHCHASYPSMAEVIVPALHIHMKSDVWPGSAAAGFDGRMVDEILNRQAGKSRWQL